MIDKKFRTPRIWSNHELKKISKLMFGDIINVSAWKDEDKEGSFYKDYFVNADKYYVSNTNTFDCGFQNKDGEIFLDLEKELSKKLKNKFDVVFNHTTLEHVYDFKKAFKNLCLMTKDVVIIVVPFLQQMHSTYGDYWRFSPLAMKRMFEDEGMEVIYSSFNNNKESSVYLFFIASKKPERWGNLNNEFRYDAMGCLLDGYEKQVGCRAIKNSILVPIVQKLQNITKK